MLFFGCVMVGKEKKNNWIDNYNWDTLDEQLGEKSKVYDDLQLSVLTIYN
jgi:hypothetical protein